MGWISGRAAPSTSQPMATYKPVDHHVDGCCVIAFITNPAAAAAHTSDSIATLCDEAGWLRAKGV
ncbi:hypothetical protein D3C72_2204950 [compost metagenome]